MTDDGTTELVERLRSTLPIVVRGAVKPGLRNPDGPAAATALERQSAALIEKDAEIARLVEALKPFAELAKCFPGQRPEWIVEGAWSQGVFSELRVGHFRAAAAALGHTSGESGHEPV